MLNDYKQNYIRSASKIPNWKSLSQIELADKYKEGGPLAESYLSAQIVKFWNIIDRTLYKDRGLYDESEAYDWYISAILYAMKHRPWENPESTIYQDPKAIEKILNMHVKCLRANWFQASNRYKRQINHDAGSLEAIKEDYFEGYQTPPEELVTEIDISSHIKLVQDCYKNGQYLLALIIDILINDVLILMKNPDDQYLVKTVKKCIQSLPEDYITTFSSTYEIPEKDVKDKFNNILKMSDAKLKSSIETYIYKLRQILKKEL